MRDLKILETREQVGGVQRLRVEAWMRFDEAGRLRTWTGRAWIDPTDSPALDHELLLVGPCYEFDPDRSASAATATLTALEGGRWQFDVWVHAGPLDEALVSELLERKIENPRM